MADTWYATDGCAGVDLETTATTQEFDLGHRVMGNDSTQWVYTQANGAITQYDAVGISETNGEAAALTKAIADDGWIIGFAQVAFADNEFGWIALKGAGSNFKCRMAASCAADAVLYTTATAGVLDDASSSQTKIDGVVLVTAVTSAAASAVIATWPKSTTF